MILPFAIAVIILSGGIQGAIILVFEDAVCPVYSEEYFIEPETYVNDQNAVVTNFTIIKTLPEKAQGRLELVGASMGEYVVSTGIDVQMNLCDLFDEPIILNHFLIGNGFSADNCPFGIGVYGSEGYIFPMDTFPDNFPPNKYMVEFSLFYEKKTLLIVQIFLNVQ